MFPEQASGSREIDFSSPTAGTPKNTPKKLRSERSTMKNHRAIFDEVNIKGTLPGNIRGTLSRNIQPTFREHSANIQGIFSQHSGNIQPTFREHSAQKLCRGVSG
jgi:hypothetical protein